MSGENQIPSQSFFENLSYIIKLILFECYISAEGVTLLLKKYFTRKKKNKHQFLEIDCKNFATKKKFNLQGITAYCLFKCRGEKKKKSKAELYIYEGRIL